MASTAITRLTRRWREMSVEMKPMPAPISSTRSPGRTICGIWLNSSASNRPSRIASRIAGVITAGSGGITTPAAWRNPLAGIQERMSRS